MNLFEILIESIGMYPLGKYIIFSNLMPRSKVMLLEKIQVVSTVWESFAKILIYTLEIWQVWNSFNIACDCPKKTCIVQKSHSRKS